MPEEFTYTIHVPYAHVDKMNVVYYAHYYVYFEMARSALLREAGVPYAELEARGVMLPVVESHCRYYQPARFDDALTVRSRIALQRLRLRIDCRVFRATECLAEGYTLHVCMTPEGRVIRPVPELIAIAEQGERNDA